MDKNIAIFEDTYKKVAEIGKKEDRTLKAVIKRAVDLYLKKK